MRLSLSLNKDLMFIVGIIIMLVCMAMMSKSSTIIASIVVILSLTMYYYVTARNNKSNVGAQVEGLCGSGSSDSLSVKYSYEDAVNVPVTTIINEPISAQACDRSGFVDRAMDSEGRPIGPYMSMADEYPIANKDAQALAGEGKPGTAAYDDQYPWGSNQSYTDCYPGPNRELNGCNINSYVSIDEANTRQVSMRTRDKKVMDGVVTKNANYYKKNFGKELDEAENKRWWGNDEY